MSLLKLLLHYRFLGLLLAGVVLMFIYGNIKYRDGVLAATNEFIAADARGADDVKTTAKRILESIADHSPIELLQSTGGLRDAESTLPGVGQ